MTQKPETKPRTHADGIPVYCAYDAIVPIGELRPNPKNPNTHPQEQIERLGKIIRGNGWRNPITVSTRSGLIVKGHGRLLTAQLEELKEVPVEYQNYESEEAELSDLTADNRIAELAEIDSKMLADVFADIDTGAIDFELSGYSEDEYKNLATALSEAVHKDAESQETETESPTEPVTKYGDIWELGENRDVIIELSGSVSEKMLPEYVDAVVAVYVKMTGDHSVSCIRNGKELSYEEISAIFKE